MTDVYRTQGEVAIMPMAPPVPPSHLPPDFELVSRLLLEKGERTKAGNTLGIPAHTKGTYPGSTVAKVYWIEDWRRYTDKCWVRYDWGGTFYHKDELGLHGHSIPVTKGLELWKRAWAYEQASQDKIQEMIEPPPEHVAVVPRFGPAPDGVVDWQAVQPLVEAETRYPSRDACVAIGAVLGLLFGYLAGTIF